MLLTTSDLECLHLLEYASRQAPERLWKSIAELPPSLSLSLFTLTLPSGGVVGVKYWHLLHFINCVTAEVCCEPLLPNAGESTSGESCWVPCWAGLDRSARLR